MVEDTILVDAAPGEPVDEDDVDWTTQHHPERQPDEGCICRRLSPALHTR